VKVIKQKQPKLSPWAEQARKERPAVKAKFGPLFDEVSAILFRDVGNGALESPAIKI